MLITPTKKFWEVFRSTNGALSCCESLFIMQAAALAPKGIYIECGVAYGKSAISALQILKEYENGKDDVRFILVDPLFDDIEIAKSVEKTVCSITEKLIPRCYEGAYSTKIIPQYEKYSYAMLDSGDHEQTILDEFYLIKDRMVSGGVIVMHDLDSQYIRVREVYNMFLATGNYEEIIPDWKSIEAYAEENNLEDGTNQSWHHSELKHPKFVGALKRK
jgi:predicted O-methyltransferase YrrM